MSYANGTTHYNLPQTVGTDKRDWFDTNVAFAAVDAALYAAATGQAADAEAITALQQTVAGQATDIAGLVTLTGQHTNQIAALNTTVNNLGTEVSDVRQDAEDMITANNEGAAATSTRAYDIGDYFIYNDVLYKATSAIAVGATIVPNTNCEATNVDTELDQINSDLAGKEPKLYTNYVQIMSDGVKTQGQLLTELSALVDFSKTNALYTRLVIGGDCFVMNNRGEALNFAAFFSISSDNLIFTRSIGTTEPYIRAYNYSMSTGTLADVSSTVPPAGLFFTLYY